MPQPYLQFESVSKRFPGVQALDRVSFGVAEGSVHALLGENGAGKSTLLKILSGAYAADEGRVVLGGQPHRFASTAEAYAAGVAVIYQEFHLVPEMTVAENLLLGHMPNRLGWLDKRAMLDAARRELDFLDEAIAPSARVSSLPIAQRQMVEIAKALMREAKVIAFDEPTSSLSDREVQKLFAIIRQLRDRGRTVIYVSHRLEEVFQVCDAVTVLRDGQNVATHDTLDGVTHDTLVRGMVGRAIEDIYGYAPRPRGENALEVEGLFGPGLSAPADLAVAQGEVVVIFGLVGAGRTELLKLIFGAERPTAGTVRVRGQPVAITNPASAIRAGIALCPEDRKQEGLVPIRSVGENINLSVRRRLAHFGIIDQRRERANAAEHIRRLDIRTPSAAQLAKNLSGGNQQKVVLARWLSEHVQVMLLDEPTRGIDVGAKREIYDLIFELARQGMGILAVSSELPEVLGIADRVLVMRQGAIVASLYRDEATEESILRPALPVVPHGEGRPAAEQEQPL